MITIYKATFLEHKKSQILNFGETLAKTGLFFFSPPLRQLLNRQKDAEKKGNFFFEKSTESQPGL